MIDHDRAPAADGSPEPSLRRQLLRGGVGSVAVKVVGTGLSFLVVVALARTLGAAGYGIYAFVQSLIAILAIPAQVGLPQLVVRETAKAHSNNAWGLMRGLWRWSNLYVGLFSLVMVLAGGLGLWLGGELLGSDRRSTLMAGLALVPLMALANVRGAALRGLRRVVLGQLPEHVLRPGLLLAVLVIVFWWQGAGSMTPAVAMGLNAGAALIAFIIGAALLLYARPPQLRAAPKTVYEARYWRRAATPLALIASLQLINGHADIVMLGVFRSDQEVGIYRAALQVATFVVFGLQAINQVLQPYIARFYVQGKPDLLQRVTTHSARIIFAVAFPLVAVMVVLGPQLLELLFRAEYRIGGFALAILAIGQLVNAGMGSVGMLLNMTGHERDTMRGVLVAAISNVILNLILIPPFGMEGAATATAVTLVIWNAVLRYYVRRRLGIESSVIGASNWRRA